MKSGSKAAHRTLTRAEDVILTRGQKLISAVSAVSLSLDEETVSAVVLGSKHYDVSMGPQTQSCNCPYFERHQKICKHLTALAFYITGTTALDENLGYTEPADFDSADFSQRKSSNSKLNDKNKNKSKPNSKSISAKPSSIDDLKKQLNAKGVFLEQFGTAQELLDELPLLNFRLEIRNHDEEKQKLIDQDPAWSVKIYSDNNYEDEISATDLLQDYPWPIDLQGVLRFIQKSWEVKHWSSHVSDKVTELFYRFKDSQYLQQGTFVNPNNIPLIFDEKSFMFRLNIHEVGQSICVTPYLKRGNKKVDIPIDAVFISDTTSAVLIDQTLTQLDSPFIIPGQLQSYVKEFQVDEMDRESFLWEIQDLDTSYIDLPKKFQVELVAAVPRFAGLIKEHSYGIDLTLGYVYDEENFRVLHRTSTQDVVFYQDGQFHQIFRDKELEATVKSDFEGILKFCFNTREYKSITREAWYGEYTIAKNLLERFATEVLPQINKDYFENIEILDLYRTTEAEIEIQLGSGLDWFELHGKVSFGNETMTLLELYKKMYLKGKDSFIQLSDGSKGIIPDELIALIERVKSLSEINTDESNKQEPPDESVLRISKHQGSLVQELYELECVKVKDRTSWKSQLKRLALKSPAKKKVPKGINATLRPYQEEGVHWLRTMHDWETGGILADDMGLGKTLQVITLIEHIKSVREDPILIVLPTSLLFNWQREFEKFSPKQSVFIYYGKNRKQELPGFLEVKNSIILTSYQLMQRDINELIPVQFDYVILDESQAIKNPSTKTHRAARLLKSRRRLAMTGTPVENNLLDLWSQFDFLNPGFLGKKSFFIEHFMKPIQDKKMKSRVESLKSLVEPFYMRRTKEVVLKELPPLQDLVIWVQLESEQQKLYDKLKKKYRDELLEKLAEDGPNKTRVKVLEGLLRLRQIACDPRLVDPESRVKSAKMMLLIEKLKVDVIENHKALVFSQFTSLLKLVAQELETEGYEYTYLDGSTRDRQKVIESFTEDEDKKIFLISLKAGGVGLNLTQADYVFHLDPWWNPAAQEQATARAHRMGQKNTVMNFKLIATGTVEEKILELQEQKKNLSNEILSSDSGMISQLDAGTIEKLFG